MSNRDVVVYAPISKWLHWLVAIIVLPMLMFSFFLDDIPDAYKSTAFMIHKSLGLTVLFLMVTRLFVTIYVGKPPLPDTVHRWEKLLSQFVQYSFYVFIFLMAI